MANEVKKTPNTPAQAKGSEAATRTGNGKSEGIDKEKLNKLRGLVEGESASRMGRDLIDTGLMDGSDFLGSIAADMGMEKVDLATVEFSPELIQQLSVNIAKKYGALPVQYTPDELWVAIADPHNVQ